MATRKRWQGPSRQKKKERGATDAEDRWIRTCLMAILIAFAFIYGALLAMSGYSATFEPATDASFPCKSKGSQGDGTHDTGDEDCETEIEEKEIYVDLAKNPFINDTIRKELEKDLNNSNSRKVFVSRFKHKSAKAHKTNGSLLVGTKSYEAMMMKLRQADKAFKESRLGECLQRYDDVLAKDPNNPMAIYGKFQCLDAISEIKRSNEYLDEAIKECRKLFYLPNVKPGLMLLGGRMCADRQKFRGLMTEAVETYEKLIKKFPYEQQLYNDAGITALMAGLKDAAKAFFRDCLRKDPDNMFAKVHLGFLVKILDKKYEQAVNLLSEGVESDQPGTNMGIFYSHLGDAYYRMGFKNKAYDIYEKAVSKGLFPSKWQRSIYNKYGLKAQPWWAAEETGHDKTLHKIEKQWRTIFDEAIKLVTKPTGGWIYERDLPHTGGWQFYHLFDEGMRVHNNCRSASKTCVILSNFAAAARCTRCDMKFILILAGTHIWPHCGPTNTRLRAQMGLSLSKKKPSKIRVQHTTKNWELGKFLIYDDSFDHEMWNDNKEGQLFLSIDMWHPQLPPEDRSTKPI